MVAFAGATTAVHDVVSGRIFVGGAVMPYVAVCDPKAKKGDNRASQATAHQPSTRLAGGGNSTQHQDAITEDYELVDYAGIKDRRKREARYLEREARRADKLRRLDEEDEMKFSHSIQFNAVPDWSSHYIAYSNLKKLIYQLEKTIHRPTLEEQDAERSPLIPAENPDQAFTRALDVELEKISSFYQLKELEIYGEVSDFLRDEETYEAESHEQLEENGRPNTSGRASDKLRQGSIFRSFTNRPRRASTMSLSIDEGIEDSDDDDNENTALQKPRPSTGQRSKSTPYDANVGKSGAGEDMRASTEFTKSIRRNSQNYEDYAEQAFSSLYSSGITLKKRAISLYVQLCELKSFIQLNKTGFSKVLKKFDKILDRNLKTKYIEKFVVPAYPFRPETMKHIEENIQRMEQAYADIVTQGDVNTAKKELRLHLREHVVWERNTVWREMIGIERKAQAANMGVRRTLLGADNDPAKARLQGDDLEDQESKELSTPVGRIRIPTWLFSSTMITLIVIIVIFIILLKIPIMKKPEQQNCLAMLIFVSLLWATEVIPLFVTSLLIPFLCVILRVVKSDDKPYHRLTADAAAKYIFEAMWSPVIMLLLGGFAVAAALSKYDIAKRIATFVLSKAGTRPRTVLVTNMFVAAFASMWISNVAAPVLCFSIIQPMLRNLPADSQMSKALILGIALSSNIGGMLSPIASPQNIVALDIMDPNPTWITWFFIVLPVGIISILLIWIILLVSFQPGRGTTIVPIRPVRDPFTGVQWFISLVTLGTIVLWCLSNELEWLVGHMGVVAIIPLVLFFGTGILTKEDFNNFLWTIIILAAGGLSLGKAVSSSGLLHEIARAITARIEDFSLYGVLVVFATLILVVATFISHTVAALIILPLVYTVGKNMEEPHPNLLVMGGALMCSAAMGLPTSGFPNMTAIMMEDSQTGQRYLKVQHFISRGIPASIVTLLVVISVGYGLIRFQNLEERFWAFLARLSREKYGSCRLVYRSSLIELHYISLSGEEWTWYGACKSRININPSLNSKEEKYKKRNKAKVKSFCCMKDPNKKAGTVCESFEGWDGGEEICGNTGGDAGGEGEEIGEEREFRVCYFEAMDGEGDDGYCDADSRDSGGLKRGATGVGKEEQDAPEDKRDDVAFAWKQTVSCSIDCGGDCPEMGIGTMSLENPENFRLLNAKVHLWDAQRYPPNQKVIQYQPKSENTSSGDCFSLIQSWIGNCSENHDACTKAGIDQSNAWYPTRLLDLGPLSDTFQVARVIVSADADLRGPYCTLSHCWGTTPFLTLTSENLESFKRQIPFQALRETFKDAIMVTRKLGVRYLWIDSLCILQSGEGSREDWQAESAQMHRVYEEGFCNIAATGSPDSSSGLFFGRDAIDIKTTEVKVDWEHLKGNFQIVDDGFWTAHIDQSPLSHRAWVMQEYLFSPRVLHFGRQQLFWECRTLHACESHPAGLPQEVSSSMESIKENCKFPPAPGSTRRSAQENATSNNWTIEEMLGAWEKVVEVYTTCNLTKQEDKLMALAGMAQRYLETKPDPTSKYLAGIWSGQTLLANLLWASRDPDTLDHAPFRPEGYRAPSWSWASIQGKIHFPLLQTVSNPKIIEVSNIVAAFTSLGSPYPTGQVTDGQLVIRGSLVKAELSDWKTWQTPNGVCLRFNGLKPSIDPLVLDDLVAPRPETCFCLGILEIIHEQGVLFYGLGLERLETGFYRRIGYFNSNGPNALDHFKAQEQQEVTII
ncbi:hypothetical protein G7Y89_g13622 [Cudoniella acicularis]|uniref:SPX domain-containing protein n=1 Tax=Cudoniella acicularis TaxID=354080 RepID=A0A8H4R7W5_9HELO|nr:hypothetical protein G7Y89_g13622 [Cudoniella acicularis]